MVAEAAAAEVAAAEVTVGVVEAAAEVAAAGVEEDRKRPLRGLDFQPVVTISDLFP